MSEPCPRRDKLFRACKFEPRYDLSPIKVPPGLASLEGSFRVLELFREKTYCGDVCVTCGRTVHPMEPQP